MSILIMGMEMPKDGYRQVFITAEGKVVYYPSSPKNGALQFKAVAVPEHGRTIDADALEKLSLPRTEIIDGEIVQNRYVSLETIRQMPTVVPADEEGEVRQ